MSQYKVSKRRPVTYGKANNKRPNALFASTALFDSTDDEAQASKLSLSRDVALPFQTSRQAPSTASSSIAPSHNGDIFDFVFGDDQAELTGTPTKRQKVSKAARSDHGGRLDTHSSTPSAGHMASRASPLRRSKMIVSTKGATVAHTQHPSIGDADKTSSTTEKLQVSARSLVNGKARTEGDGLRMLQSVEESRKSPASPARTTYNTRDRGTRNEYDVHELYPESPKRPQARDPRNRTPTLLGHQQEPQTSGPRSTDGVLTPKGLGTWHDLLGHASEAQGAGGSQVLTPQSQRSVAQSDALKAEYTPRKRLIDSLAEQSNRKTPALNQQGSEDDDTIWNAQSHDQDRLSSSSSIASADATHAAKNTLSAQRDLVVPASQASSSRVTYSRQRSMLADQAASEKMSFDLPLLDEGTSSQGQRRGSLPALAPLHSLHENDEQEDSQTLGIKTVHELRQAGANSRFNDEVGDLLDLIGQPGSTTRSRRRAGLLELANKLNEKDFHSKFISHGLDQKLFVHLDIETDTLSGFLIISILLSCTQNGITAIAIAQLQRQGVSRLLSHLLDSTDDVIDLAKSRKSNMSKVMQRTFIDFRNDMLSSKSWAELQSTSISPRSCALRCLDMILRQGPKVNNGSKIMTEALTTKLFEIVDIDDDVDKSSSRILLESIDFQLALSILELNSVNATIGSYSSPRLDGSLPVVNRLLQRVLRGSTDEFIPQQLLVLRLTLNVTNNNAGACDEFADKGLCQDIGRSIAAKFTLLSEYVAEEDHDIILDHLLLMLGMMINFAEWSSHAWDRFCTERAGKELIDNLVHICVSNLDRMAEVSRNETSCFVG